MSDNADLKKLVADLQSTVKQSKAIHAKTGATAEGFRTLFPVANATAKSETIGVIFDEKSNVQDLMAAGLINPPDNLSWLHLKTYDELTKFFKDRGVPGYISFGSAISYKEDEMAAVKAYTKACKDAKLSDLPTWSVHSPVISKKNKIENYLLGY
jgi:hypothetical protein